MASLFNTLMYLLSGKLLKIRLKETHYPSECVFLPTHICDEVCGCCERLKNKGALTRAPLYMASVAVATFSVTAEPSSAYHVRRLASDLHRLDDT